MNRRTFLKGVGAATVMTGVPWKVGAAPTISVEVRREVVKSFRPVGYMANLLAPKFVGEPRDIVRKLYRVLLGNAHPSMMDVELRVKQWEKNRANTLRWFFRQPEFRSSALIGADRIQYPSRPANLSERHWNVLLLRWAQVQKVWLAIAGKLPTQLEAMETVAYLARVNKRKPRRKHVRKMALIELNRAHAQGFSDPEGTALGNDFSAAVIAEAQAQGLAEAQQTAVVELALAGLAALAVSAEIAGPLAAAIAAGELGGVLTLTIAGPAVALTIAATLASGAFLITIALDLALGTNIVISAPKPNEQEPTVTPPEEPQENTEAPAIAIDITNQVTVTTIDVPTVTEAEAATAAAVDESEGNGVSTDEGGAPGGAPAGDAPSDGPSASDGGGGAGSDGGGGDGGGDGGGCKLLPLALLRLIIGDKVTKEMEKKNGEI